MSMSSILKKIALCALFASALPVSANPNVAPGVYVNTVPSGEDPLRPGEESMENDPEPEVGGTGNPPR
jgi:hypothetical protein